MGKARYEAADLVTLDSWLATEAADAAALATEEPLDPSEWTCAGHASAYAPTLPVVFATE